MTTCWSKGGRNNKEAVNEEKFEKEVLRKNIWKENLWWSLNFMNTHLFKIPNPNAYVQLSS